MAGNNDRINCFRCIYFYVTWDKKHGRGCRAFGFKSKDMPSAVVYRSSGEPCLKFNPKQAEIKRRGRYSYMGGVQ